jgi:hypothetical protein
VTYSMCSIGEARICEYGGALGVCTLKFIMFVMMT